MGWVSFVEGRISHAAPVSDDIFDLFGDSTESKPAPKPKQEVANGKKFDVNV